jgi:hypothetical protein
MAWIELHQELPRHPKTDLLMDVAGIRRATAVGHVTMTILWGLEFSKDGFIASNRIGAVARAADWEGSAQSFGDVMAEAGWWDRVADGFVIHDWEQYAGRLMDKRREDAERKRTQRGGSKVVQRTSGGHLSDGAGNSNHDQHDKPVCLPHVHAHETTGNETPKRVDRIFGVPREQAWKFAQADLGVLVEAGETIGVAAEELPRKIGRFLAKREDESYAQWFAMEPALVALWCRKAVKLAIAAKGPHGETICPYIAGIIGDRLKSGANLLEEGGNLTQFRGGAKSAAIEAKRAEIDAGLDRMAAKGLFDVI